MCGMPSMRKYKIFISLIFYYYMLLLILIKTTRYADMVVSLTCQFFEVINCEDPMYR